ncbi:hypothetical protein BAAM0499_03730 [Bifidobacterium animalis subsp. animalis MCC 0499]|uniref:hypothetical protein n=1 Tax=Bifidobacterium animalis TaxID=28025 RepID=UPI00069C9111|nr:hypothetical protein [Bifidobacterium animalis]KOA60989.1 hypothetical protein BAAM0499_03730 [Bifidobacterium animalis subsp. animalis MCC 0499]
MMVNSNGQELLAWLDVETTGLQAKRDALLEVGVTITDLQGVERESCSWTIHHDRIPCTKDTVKAFGMHTANGLLEACFDDTRSVPLNMVERGLLDMLADQARHAVDGRLHPAGTNLQFDLDWLYTKFSPEGAARLESLLSYRRLDLTAFRLGAQARALMTGVESEAEHLPSTDHRVDTCLNRDLAEYRAWLGKGEE